MLLPRAGIGAVSFDFAQDEVNVPSRAHLVLSVVEGHGLREWRYEQAHEARQEDSHARPRPGDPHSPRVLARSDSAGATHLFAAACRKEGVEFSFGFPVDERIQHIVDLIPDQCWHPATEDDGELRDGAWVAEATGMTGLSSWPEGSRLILRKERPHPGAQLTFTDIDGHRITAFLTDTARGVIPGQSAGLELRHRQHRNASPGAQSKSMHGESYRRAQSNIYHGYLERRHHPMPRHS